MKIVFDQFDRLHIDCGVTDISKFASLLANVLSFLLACWNILQNPWRKLHH